jgi:sialate O-acetylesterase
LTDPGTATDRTLLPRHVDTEVACLDLAERPFSVCPLFSDGMVLQRDQENWVWGTAPRGAGVVVEVDGERFPTRSGEDGRWRVVIRSLPVGGPYTMTVCSGGRTIAIADILSGDIWLCAGQSNMEWPLAKIDSAEGEIAAAQYPSVRYYGVSHAASSVPVHDLPKGDRWHACSPANAQWFSAVGYFFARDLHLGLGIPIGLIDNSYGGTCAEAWTSIDAVRADPSLHPILARHDGATADESAYQQSVEVWRKDVAEWNSLPEAEQTQWPVMLKWWRRIRPPYGHPHCVDGPGSLFNANVHPLSRYGIKGVLWYQGESNVDRASEYRALLAGLIQDWRARWSQPELPFLVVQLANCGMPEECPVSSPLAELRDAQRNVIGGTSGAALVVTIDVGDATNCHPSNKAPVGHRLYLAALSVAYGRRLVSSGPIYERMEVEGEEIRLYFSSAGRGLVARGGGPLRHFGVSGPSGRFLRANARIEENAVVVYHPEVTNPVAVRYAWSGNPDGCNLYNEEGLPASPFRTDSALLS